MAHYLVWRSLISPPQFQGAAYPSSVSEKMLFSSLLLCFTRLNYVRKTAIFNPKMRRSQKILSPTAWEMSWPSPWQSNRFVIITPVDKIFAFEDLAILLTCAICNFNFRKWNVDWIFRQPEMLVAWSPFIAKASILEGGSSEWVWYYGGLEKPHRIRRYVETMTSNRLVTLTRGHSGS